MGGAQVFVSSSPDHDRRRWGSGGRLPPRLRTVPQPHGPRCALRDGRPSERRARPVVRCCGQVQRRQVWRGRQRPNTRLLPTRPERFGRRAIVLIEDCGGPAWPRSSSAESLDAHGGKMLVKLRCPHCGRPGVSGLRKLFLGPVTWATCRECGKRVSVSYLSVLWIIPSWALVIWLAMTPLSEEPIWHFPVLGGGALLIGVLGFMSMPLQKR